MRSLSRPKRLVWQPYSLAVLPSVLVFLAYLPALGNPFVLDDLGIFAQSLYSDPALVESVALVSCRFDLLLTTLLLLTLLSDVYLRRRAVLRPLLDVTMQPLHPGLVPYGDRAKNTQTHTQKKKT